MWRQLSAGTYDGYVQHLPDELQELAEQWAEGLRDQFTAIHVQTVQTASGLHFPTRKQLADWVMANVPPYRRGLVFAAVDGKDITPAIWRMLEPSGAKAL